MQNARRNHCKNQSLMIEYSKLTKEEFYMQQCGRCFKVYDESEYPHCPYCEGLLNDEDEGDFEEEDEVCETDAEILKFNRIINCPGVFDDEGEYVRCPACGHGLHNDNGTIICPQCGPV